MITPRNTWLAAMASLQVGWMLTRSLLTREPFDASILAVCAAAVSAAVAVLLLPSGAAARILDSLERRPRRAAFAVAGLGCAAGFVASLLQPFPSLDEAFVARAAASVAQSGLAGLLEAYRDNDWLARRHPPLGPLLFGAMTWGGLGGAWLRSASVVLLGLTALLTFDVADRLAGRRSAVRAGLAVATFPLLARMAGLAMNELLLTALATACIALVLRLDPSAGRVRGIALGVTLGAAALVKYTMVLLGPVVVGIAWARQPLARVSRPLATSLGVAGGLLVVWLLVLFAIGAGPAQIGWLSRVATMAGRGTAAAWFGPWSLGETLVAKLPSAVGLYHLPLLALGAWQTLRRGGALGRVIWIWLGGIGLPLLFTLPENRYFLPAFPALAILLAIGSERLPTWWGELGLLAFLLCLVTVGYYGSLEVTVPARLLGAGP